MSISAAFYDQDIEVFGEDTRWEVIRSATDDRRAWIGESPVCPLLKTHGIAHVGRMWAGPGFQVIRLDASGTFVLAGLEGQGETLIDGQWRTIKENEICLRWTFGWVRYQESGETSQILSSDSPVIQKSSVAPLKHAIAGLSAELAGETSEDALQHHWVELIHRHVLKAARPYQRDDRLWNLWKTVENDLARHWTLDDLGKIAHVSHEHLRRLCKQQLGRSPIQQLTYLRIHRAVSLLTTSDDKIETIAREVGYDNPFTFSNAFKRWTGRRPSDFQQG